jgi:hypothetical protein
MGLEGQERWLYGRVSWDGWISGKIGLEDHWVGDG